MVKTTTIVELSDEILLLIVANIEIGDIIRLSETCTRFDRLLHDRTLCRHITIPWNVDLQRKTIVRFLVQPDRATIITQLTLHNVYWIPSGVIKGIVVKLKSLQGLYVAGASLSYIHLLQILANPSTRLSALSWTWDDALESLLRPRTQLNQPYETLWAELLAIRDKSDLLRSLIIHIPEIFNSTRLIVSSHSSLCFLISLCTNLEELWILSWPKTIQEMKHSANLPHRQIVLPEIKLPRLHTFIFSVLEPLKIHVPNLTAQLINSFQTKEKDSGHSGAAMVETDSNSSRATATAAKKLWVDHPLLGLDFWGGTALLSHWPNLNLRYVEHFCLSLNNEEVLNTLHDLRRCKHLLVTHGCVRIISLNRLLQEAINLESFHSKTFNSRLDWTQFIQIHPKLKAINVSEDLPIAEAPSSYPDACVAMGKLKHLEKLSLPLYCLFEIRSGDALANYHQKLTTLDQRTNEERSGTRTPSTAASSPGAFVSDLFSKGKRVGRVEMARTPNSISGLDYLTLLCPDVEEFETGFTRIELGGNLVIGSLGNISRWIHLKRLTLDSLPIPHGQFLIDIAKAACGLESIRLKDLGPSAKCIYINSLCTALKLCSKLKDFRLEQKYIGATAPLCEALESCPKLERVFVHSSSNDRPLEPPGFLKLMATSKHLFVLYLILGSATKSSCLELRKRLELLYAERRPALSVVIQTSIDADVVQFHSIHYRDMVVFAPQVCAYPCFPNPN